MWQQGIIPKSGMYYVLGFATVPIHLTLNVDEMNGIWYTWAWSDSDDPEFFGSTNQMDNNIDEMPLYYMEWAPYHEEYTIKISTFLDGISHTIKSKYPLSTNDLEKLLKDSSERFSNKDYKLHYNDK